MDAFQIQVAKRGVITLPKALRDENQIREGDSLTLLDLGGMLIIVPRHLEIDKIADRLAEKWTACDENLESMLKTLREVRDEYAAQG